MATITTSPSEIYEAPLDQVLGERYLSYALSTIMARSLPDARDGLKPVHRRILYAMQESGNTSDKPYRKSASAVGYVMMKYHPHGDDPIYEAMVRMAQDFASRYPLIDGQGNFGSIDGDNAAAMRYTEVRLAACAGALLEGIHENAVDFQPTYNGETQEPVVLPAAFPNVLANGASGIAVGMATSVPPHNIDEVCQALLLLLREPGVDLAKILECIPGPDFPTGGVIVEDPAMIAQAYATGRGSIRLRARWAVEDLKAGQYQIVVTEIPYQVQKARLIEKIADLWNQKKLPLLADIRDESTTDVRIVLVPKSRTVEPEILMESLFRQTDLEIRFNVNMNLLDQGRVPRVMSLKEVLQAFLHHRREVLCRRTHFRIEQIVRRLEVLAGYLIAYLHLDEVIRLIREEDNPKHELMNRWALTEVQAEAILNMRLRALRKLEEIEIRKEYTTLQEEKQQLEELLASVALQSNKIAQDIRIIQDKFGAHHPHGKRRTHFAKAPQIAEQQFDALIEREPITVICSEKGWIRVLKGHITDPQDLKYKEGDQQRFVCMGETTDKVLIFSTNGRFYTITPDKLPGGRGHGEPIRLMIDLEKDDDILALMVVNAEQIQHGKLLLASSDGRGFIVAIKDVLAQTRSGKQVLSMPKNTVARVCCPIEGDAVAVLGTNRKLLIFKREELPELTRGRGVMLQKYKSGQLADIKTLSLDQGLSWKIGEKVRLIQDLRPWLGKRGQIGRMPPVGFPRINKFSA
jgi:topoisomerase-4 subunit A